MAIEKAEFKVGDRVRVTRHPTANWTRDMFIGREFVIWMIAANDQKYGDCAYDESECTYIPLDFVELASRGIDPASDAEPEFKVKCHKFNDEHARKLTDALPANVAARARNIAALAAELRKPVEPRFPHEGKSDRVTGYRRWDE